MDDSLTKRFLYKLGGGALGLPLNLLTQVLITRTLGPAGYGNYGFLVSFFNSLISIFDAGSSSGFYSKVSARPEERELIAFYWRLAAGIALVILMGVGTLLCFEVSTYIWPGQAWSNILLALLCAIGIWYTSIGGKIVDAFGRTATGEKHRLGGRIVGVLLLAGVVFLGKLQLEVLFGIQILVAAITLFLWHRQLVQGGLSLFPRVSLGRVRSAEYGAEFWQYSHPILLLTLIGAIVAIADRWMLEQFDTGFEQGYFTLGLQLSTLCFLFTSAMVPLLAREFSQAFHAKEIERLRESYLRHVPKFYAFAAFLGIFAAVEADRVSLVMGGAGFAQAEHAVMLMCLYPIHQTLGQFNGSIYYAIGETRLYRNTGVIALVVGVGLTYLFVAPIEFGGMALGAVGLAWKMIVYQILAVYLQLWYVCRMLKMPFWALVGQQTLVVAIFALIAVGVKTALSGFAMSPMLGLLVTGMIYGSLVVASVWFFPGLCALSRADIVRLIRRWWVKE